MQPNTPSNFLENSNCLKYKSQWENHFTEPPFPQLLGWIFLTLISDCWSINLPLLTWPSTASHPKVVQVSFPTSGFCFWARWNNRDQTYPPVWNNRKMDRIYKTKVSKTINNRQLKIVTSEKCRTNEGGPKIAQLIALRSISSTQRRNSGIARWTTWVKDTELRIQGHRGGYQ